MTDSVVATVESIVTTDIEGVVTVVRTEEAAPVVISMIDVGPQGPRGEAGGDVVSYTAAVTLSGNRMVVLEDGKIQYADCSVLSHGCRVIGMTTGAIMAGVAGDVRRTGIIEEPTWDWAVNSLVWLGLTGLISTSPPGSGFSLIIGFAVSSTKLMIDIREPIYLV